MNKEKRTIGPVLRRSIVRAQGGTGGRSLCRVCRRGSGLAVRRERIEEGHDWEHLLRLRRYDLGPRAIMSYA